MGHEQQLTYTCATTNFTTVLISVSLSIGIVDVPPCQVVGPVHDVEPREGEGKDDPGYDVDPLGLGERAGADGRLQKVDEQVSNPGYNLCANRIKDTLIIHYLQFWSHTDYNFCA